MTSAPSNHQLHQVKCAGQPSCKVDPSGNQQNVSASKGIVRTCRTNVYDHCNARESAQLYRFDLTQSLVDTEQSPSQCTNNNSRKINGKHKEWNKHKTEKKRLLQVIHWMHAISDLCHCDYYIHPCIHVDTTVHLFERKFAQLFLAIRMIRVLLHNFLDVPSTR